MRRSMSQTLVRDTGSSPVVGSSRKKIRGSWTSARAISTRRRIPPESCFTGLSAHSVSSTAASSSPMSFRRRSEGTPYSLAKIVRFSRGESSRSLVIACGITPIARRTSSGCATTSAPAITAVPDVGMMSVVSIRSSVDLPAPFGPRSPRISPDATSNEMASTAVNVPNVFVISRTSIALMTVPTRGRGRRRSSRRQAAGRDCRCGAGSRRS